MDEILRIAKENTETAFKLIKEIDIISIWESVGAEINQVGSLKTNLLMKHRDIDFHIYSDPLDISQSFSAMAKLASNKNIVKIEYTNLIDTEEECIEWHAWCKDSHGEVWQLDMIHMGKGSRYDGFFEKVADRINEVITDEQRNVILKLKYDTPESEKIMGIEYYMAVISDGVSSYNEFVKWRQHFDSHKAMKWLP